MSDTYNCPVCWEKFSERNAPSTTCKVCNCSVCPDCLDISSVDDICDMCASEMSETQKGLTEQELADKWIEEMKACEYTYDDMLRVFDIARQKYRRILEKEAV